MPIQQLKTIDENANFFNRMKQSAELLQADPTLINYYGQMRKERRSKEAAKTAYDNLRAKSKGNIEFRPDPNNELESPLIKKEKDFDKNVQAGATDYSFDPQAEARLAAQWGNQQASTHIDGYKKDVTELGDFGKVQQAMKDDLFPQQTTSVQQYNQGAQSSPPVGTQKATSWMQDTPLGKVLAQGNAATPSVIPLQDKKTQEATDNVFSALKASGVPMDKVRVGQTASRSSNQGASVHSGQGSPLTTNIQYSQPGFADMNPDVQGMYIDKEAADIENSVREAHGLSPIPNINDRKLADATERFRGLNQALNPNFRADIQGGNISGPGYSQNSGSSTSNSQNYSPGAGQQAPPANVRTSSVTGSGDTPGRIQIEQMDNGDAVIRPSYHGHGSFIPPKTIKQVLDSGTIGHGYGKDRTAFSEAERQELKTLIQQGYIDPNDGRTLKDVKIPRGNAARANLFEKLNRIHLESDRAEQSDIGTNVRTKQVTEQATRR